MQTAEKIYILDCGSQYTQLIARRIRELGVYSEVLAPDTPLAWITARKPRGIIISGSPDSTRDGASVDAAILKTDLPLLAICYGMQLILDTGGADIIDSAEFGGMEITVQQESQLFASLPSSFTVWMSHSYEARKMPQRNYKLVARSTAGAIAAVEHRCEPKFAVQFHPEVEHSEHGKTILRNFTYTVCGCQGNWQIDNIVQSKLQRIRSTVDKDRVLLALSGGVDSAVVAALLHKAIGKQLTAIFVDTGLLREGEAQQVKETFAQQFSIDLRTVNAKDRFFKALAGISDPEQKRKVIGKTFIEVFEKEANTMKECKWLAQGTIYPDVIESAHSSEKAHVIKSHHNVGGLPETMQLKLIEPLRDLFKDEVRLLGEKLGLPKELVYRHPFPGPGLAVRVLGEVKSEFVEIARQADAIFIDQLRKHGLYDKVSQAFVVFLPVRTVGVKGDNRVYEYVVTLRAVETTDFMTATAAQLSHDFLQLVTNQILNKIKGVTRVCYDISSKPPATIEWE